MCMSAYVHLTCVSSLTQACVQADRKGKKRKGSIFCFPALLQRCPTPVEQAVPKWRAGAEASTKAINNQV